MENTRKKRQAKSDPTDVYAEVTTKIIAALEAGTVPWRQPWDPTVGTPVSLSSGKPYRGINVLLLGLEAQLAGYSSPFWGTYKQLGERGGQVRKGEKSTLVTFWKRVTSNKLDEATGQREAKTFMMLKHFRVFNAEQADPIEAGTVLKTGDVATGEIRLPALGGHDFVPTERCEEILTGYFGTAASPALVVGQDGRAFYSPSRDTVSLPPREAFTSSAHYYSTAFHEATHSTGHRSRLARDGVLEGHPFGSSMYAAEELVAEVGAALLCGHAGIDNETLPASAAYLENWLAVLKNDRRLLLSACAKAQKATDLVLGVTYEPEAEASTLVDA